MTPSGHDHLQSRTGTSRGPSLIFVIFFATGFSALLYQVIWQRMLGLFAGSEVHASAIIVGAFLAGLGLGSLLGGVVADRLSARGALRLYGMCNGLIALYALLSKPLLYDVLYLQLGFQALSPAVTLVLVFASLLLPTLLMGLSLPLVSRSQVSDVDQAARRITALYAVNTLGSALGSMLTTWVLAGTLGYEGALLLGAAISAGAGAAAWLSARALSAEPPQRASGTAGTAPLRLSRVLLGWCALVFLSGFMAIALEILWFRILTVALKSNAYTYGHLLTFILLGTSLGSFIGARYVTRSARPFASVLRILIAGVIVALVTLIALSEIMASSSLLHSYFRATNGYLNLAEPDLGFAVMAFVVWIVLPALILLPANILLGAYFPFVQKAVQTDSAQVGQRVGLVSLANILGNTAGSLVTGLVLLNLIGTVATLQLIALIGLGFALLLLRETRRWTAAALGAGALAAGLAFPAPADFWMRLLGSPPQDDVITAEDASGVAILRRDPEAWSLLVDGILQGQIPFMVRHTSLGLFSALAHPDPRTALVIGIGSGGTPYGVGVMPGMERIDAVEIVGAEIPVLQQLARQHPDSGIRPLIDDARVRLIVADGRRVLQQTDARYDIIEADAIYPWRSHAGMLYSQEFFESARSRLQPGGLMAQWAPTERTRRTFLSVFPYGVRLGDVLIGSADPLRLSIDDMLARLDAPQTTAYLQAAGLDPAPLRELLLQDAPVPWTPDTPRDTADLNRDLWPRDEYYLNVPAGP